MNDIDKYLESDGAFNDDPDVTLPQSYENYFSAVCAKRNHVMNHVANSFL